MDDRQPISANEAQEALKLIEATTRQMRRALAHGGTPYFFLIWGTVWLLAFGSTQFLGPESPVAGLIWVVLDILGGIASFVVGWRLSLRLRGHTYGPTIGLFWLAWIVYAALIVYFARPQSGDQLSLLVSLFAMFGYVVMGIMFRSTLIGGLGAVLTLLIIAGYLLIPAYFNLWMAVLGGGSLIGVGLYILYAWS